MIQHERLDMILKSLNEAKSLSLRDIMSLTGASRDTVRRDIIKLSDSNLVERNYGGISLPNSFNKLDSYLERNTDLLAIKKSLAKKAAGIIKEERIIYLDVSTTVEFVPHYLPHSKQLLSVTNSLDIADQLLRNSKSKTRLLGGALDREKRCVAGAKPLLEMGKFEFDISFLSCAGITEKGIYYAYDEDIELKAKILDQSKKVVLIFDNTKVNVQHNFKIYDFGDIDYFVTNKLLPDNLTTIIDSSKIVYLKENA